MKKLYMFITIATAIIGGFVYSGLFINFVNKFFPCVQNPMYSFPCNGIYDVTAGLAAFALVVVWVIYSIYKLYKWKKQRVYNI